ncbi:MAG: TrmH family RNA methyltransferase [Candidatus Syntrophosphaera sp.]
MSKTKLKSIAKLRQKKYRLLTGQVVVEGIRAISQIKEYGIIPLEQYCLEGAGSAIWADVPAYALKDQDMGRICSSEHPQTLAALFPVPGPRKVEFRRAFYLDGIGDPGNLGAIFRLAAAFGIDCLYLSPQCVEVSSPKVIRASLGSVYHVSFEVLPHSKIKDTGAGIFIADSHKGLSIGEFHPTPYEKVIVAFGSEAHGISEGLSSLTPEKLHIQTSGHIESLNVSIAAGIIAHHLYMA